MMPMGHLGIPFVPFIGMRSVRVSPWLLMLGSLLPDLIDKPLGHIVLPLNNGRVFAHTLLFAFIVLGAAFVNKGLMPLSMGVSSHLLLDGMFLDPVSALWPLLGPFPRTDFVLSNWLDAFADPEVLAWETAGALVLALFILGRYRTRSGSASRG